MTVVEDAWPVNLGSDVVTDLESAIRREWLVTNGRGSYAFGTVAGIATRSYHGLLVGALDAPVGRTVLVGGLAEWVEVAGTRVALHAHGYADGIIDQRDFNRLRSFRLDGMLPVFTYAVGDVLVASRTTRARSLGTTPSTPHCGIRSPSGRTPSPRDPGRSSMSCFRPSARSSMPTSAAPGSGSGWTRPTACSAVAPTATS